ncbi:MAG: hypothetical protein JW818_00455 [Pirellulales bacterium]|nr:hypothetical protein [Pirellulales bacterium]
MSRFWILAVVVCLLAAVPVSAQEKARDNNGQTPQVTLSTSQVAATPEMWFYEQQLRQSSDTSNLSRRISQFRTQQRLHRQETMYWFGMSNARPTCSPDPLYGVWSPTWGGNTPGRPNLWSGWGRPWVVVRQPANSATR